MCHRYDGNQVAYFVLFHRIKCERDQYDASNEKNHFIDALGHCLNIPCVGGMNKTVAIRLELLVHSSGLTFHIPEVTGYS